VTTVRRLEKKISRIEGFNVRLRHADGRKDGRFKLLYDKHEIYVLRADGTKAHGNRLLFTVRDTYLD